jgi:hypothetical protein
MTRVSIASTEVLSPRTGSGQGKKLIGLPPNKSAPASRLPVRDVEK